MSFRKLALPFFVAVLCLGQATWQTVTDPPGVDWNGLSGAKKTAALRVMQTEECACGCGMKIAECRVKDPSCGISRKLAKATVAEFAAGKDAATVKADLKRIAGEPPPLFDDPVKISTAGDPVRGPEKARLTIVEFSDFQCPYCSKAVGETKEVLRQFPNDVRLVFKQFPLDSHSQAEFGAEVALAAQTQGKFWEMHDLLYAGFPDISRNRVMAYARQLKLDMKRFTSELDSHKYRARVLAEEKEGEDAGVAGTPSFYFNGKKYNGQFDVASVVPLVKKELSGKN
ncbi:MAG TPA: thioredoxin domain-containing protein [Bryobacteraceae bacterium]|nr:thioredoxin domain-containing protein [Bryobacteraceae bacterium]